MWFIRRRLAGRAAPILVALLLAGCGSSEDGATATSTASPSASPSGTATATPPPSTTPAATPEATETADVGEVDFQETGTLVRDNPGLPPDTWFLVYEEPGAPALTIELVIDDRTTCTAGGAATPCDGLAVGDRVSVSGVALDDTVEAVLIAVDPQPGP